MAGAYSSQSYDAVAEDLSAAVEWIQHLGIDYSRTRIGEYERAAELLVSAYHEQRIALLREEFPRLNNALFEIHDLIGIHRALAGRFDTELSKHIKTYASGPVTYTDEKTESSSNLARNIGFELGVMASLTRAGVPLDFSIPADVAARFDGRTLLFECKRPQSADAVRTRVKGAFRQLELKYQSARRNRYRGLIALDITKALNPSFDLCVTDDRISIDQVMSGLVDQFLHEHRSSWEVGRGRRTIGVLVRLRQMNVVEGPSRSKLFYGQQLVLTPITHVGMLNVETVRSIAAVLESSKDYAA